MATIIKVEFEGSLRRIPVSVGNGDMSFADLEAKIRKLFKLPNTAQLKMTYTDNDGDIVTLCNEQELTDACHIQKLNPLRLQVLLIPSETVGNVSDAQAAPAQTPEVEQQSSNLETSVKKIVDAYVPLFEGIFPSSQIPEMLDTIVKRVTAQLFTVRVSKPEDLNYGVTSSDEPSSSAPPKDAIQNDPSSNNTATTNEEDVNSAEPLAETTNPVGHDASNTSTISKAPSKTENDAKILTEDSVCHEGVTCDVCKRCPITGVRFKAIKKVNYDLCGSCFEKVGNPDEYNRIEEPLSRPSWGPIPVKMVHLSPSGTRRIGPNSAQGDLFGRGCRAPIRKW